jgi:hypothetical protein
MKAAVTKLLAPAGLVVLVLAAAGVAAAGASSDGNGSSE